MVKKIFFMIFIFSAAILASPDNDLKKAVATGNGALAEKSLAKGANTEIKNSEGLTPLAEACRGRYVSIVAMLIKKKANVNAQGKDGKTIMKRVAEEIQSDEKKAEELGIPAGREPTHMRDLIEIHLMLRDAGALEN